MMKYAAITFGLIAATVSLPVLAHPAHDHGTGATTKGLVKILAPKHKSTVTGNVDVKWQIVKKGNVQHVHLYLDGEELGPQNGTHKQLLNLSKGSHTVKVGVATFSHHELATDTVTFVVK